MLNDTLETVPDDLSEALARIEATREALQSALDSQDGDMPAVLDAIRKLDRLAAEVSRVEHVFAGQLVAAGV